MFTAKSPADPPNRDAVLSMSGLDFMLGILHGEIPSGPIWQGLNYTLDQVEDGRVVFRGTPACDQTNPLGGVHGEIRGVVDGKLYAPASS